METSANEWTFEKSIPAEKIGPLSNQYIFVLFKRPGKLPTCSFWNNLKFTVGVLAQTNNPDSVDDRYGDEYKLEECSVNVSDYIVQHSIDNFDVSWEEIGEEFQKGNQFVLTMASTIEEAVVVMIKYLGMRPCNNTDVLEKKKLKKHILLLGGIYNGELVLARIRMIIADGGIGIDLVIKSKNEEIREQLSSYFS